MLEIYTYFIFISGWVNSNSINLYLFKPVFNLLKIVCVFYIDKGYFVVKNAFNDGITAFYNIKYFPILTV